VIQAVARIVGKRKGVHRLAGDPGFTGSCHVGFAAAREYLTADQLAAIVTATPRRLCGHCYRTRD
jgi:hypothetical protein